MRYYFHFRDEDALIPDDEGIECATFEQAVCEARASARDLALQSLNHGLPIPHGIIEMTKGLEVLMSVSLNEILHPH